MLVCVTALVRTSPSAHPLQSRCCAFSPLAFRTGLISNVTPGILASFSSPRAVHVPGECFACPPLDGLPRFPARFQRPTSTPPPLEISREVSVLVCAPLEPSAASGGFCSTHGLTAPNSAPPSHFYPLPRGFTLGPPSFRPAAAYFLLKWAQVTLPPSIPHPDAVPCRRTEHCRAPSKLKYSAFLVMRGQGCGKKDEHGGHPRSCTLAGTGNVDRARTSRGPFSTPLVPHPPSARVTGSPPRSPTAPTLRRCSAPQAPGTTAPHSTLRCTASTRC
ncbi:hypothetical protein B0H10DRAFT_2222551 [Mycena sp. CBHHK59/15]|nr:hypothetical protein B0H10DRAFT_2222551 [Mycena sp. CBHHK59/15]